MKKAIIPFLSALSFIIFIVWTVLRDNHRDWTCVSAFLVGVILAVVHMWNNYKIERI